MFAIVFLLAWKYTHLREKYILRILVKKEFNHELDIIKIRNVYEGGQLVPITTGLKKVDFRDRINGEYFSMAINCKKNKYRVFNIGGNKYNIKPKDTKEQIISNILKNRRETENLRKILNKKYEELKNIISCPYFVFVKKNHVNKSSIINEKNGYGIIVFFHEELLKKGVFIDYNNKMKNYLQKNKSDTFIYIPLTYRKFFNTQLQKGYFNLLEKVQEPFSKKKHLNKEILLNYIKFQNNWMVFLKSFQIEHRKDLLEEIEKWEENSWGNPWVQKTRVKIWLKEINRGYFTKDQIFMKPGALIREKISEKVKKEFNLEDIYWGPDDFFTKENGEIFYRNYDVRKEGDTKVKTIFVEYNFTADKLKVKTTEYNIDDKDFRENTPLMGAVTSTVEVPM